MVALDPSQDIGGTRLQFLKTAAQLPNDFPTNPADLCPPAGQTLNDNVYADSVMRRLPCHTKNATLASAAYFYSAPYGAYGAHGRALIEPSIAEWARYHQVEPEVQAIKEALTKTAEVEKDAFIANTRIPARNDDEIRAGVAHLRKHAASYLVPDRRAIATELFERSKNLSVEDADFLQKVAGVGTTTWRSLSETFEKLAAYCVSRQKPEAAAFFDRYAKTASKVGDVTDTVDGELLNKLANESDVVMRESFGRGVDSTQFFEVTPVAVQDYLYQHVKLANHAVVKFADFGKCSTEKLAGLLGVETAANIVQLTPVGRSKLASFDPVLAEQVCAIAEVTPVERPRSWTIDLASLAKL